MTSPCVDPNQIPDDSNGQIVRFYRALPTPEYPWSVCSRTPVWTGNYQHLTVGTGETGFFKADSTRIIVQNLVNGGHSSVVLQNAIGCYSAGCSGPTGPTIPPDNTTCGGNPAPCTFPFGPGCSPLYGVTGNYAPCYPPPNPITFPCVRADGVVQFISQVTAQPGFNWAGEQAGICVTLSPLGLTGPCSADWNPLTFTIGDCKQCRKCISLVGFTCSVDAECCEDTNSAAYDSVQVDVRFDLKNKLLQQASFTKACNLTVAVFGPQSVCFQANFAISRVCYNDPSNPLALLIISPYIPLSYLHYHSVYNTPPAYLIISPIRLYGNLLSA